MQEYFCRPLNWFDGHARSMAGEPESRRFDRFLRALSDSTRRLVLSHLHAADTDRFTLDELAAVVASEVTASAASADTRRETARVALHHRHLPKLAAVGLIDYDPHSGRIRYRGTPDGAPVDVPTLLDPLAATADTLGRSV